MQALLPFPSTGGIVSITKGTHRTNLAERSIARTSRKSTAFNGFYRFCRFRLKSYSFLGGKSKTIHGLLAFALGGVIENLGLFYGYIAFAVIVFLFGFLVIADKTAIKPQLIAIDRLPCGCGTRRFEIYERFSAVQRQVNGAFPQIAVSYRVQIPLCSIQAMRRERLCRTESRYFLLCASNAVRC